MARLADGTRFVQPDSTNRIRFANQLRGLAALSVATSHLVGVYWLLPGVVSAVTFSPDQAGPPPSALLGVVAYPWFNFGPFGVAVFFLISGFVIPFSLEQHSRTSFAAARLLRIYPTYVAAFLLEMAVVYAASLAWHRSFAYGATAVVTNALLIYDLVGQPSADLVNWTLSVELKFYGLAILLFPAIRAGRAGILVAAGASVLLLNGLMAAGLVGDIAAPPSTVSYTVSSHSVCLGYMLIGVAFNFHHRRLMPGWALWLTAEVLAALFVSSWRLSVWGGQYPVVTLNYLYALILFGGLYAIRRFVPPVPVLDAMAAISFPFYLVHSLVGYSLLRALMVGGGLSYYPALAITLPALLAIAAALHVLVERPSARAGRQLGRLRAGVAARVASR